MGPSGMERLGYGDYFDGIRALSGGMDEEKVVRVVEVLSGDAEDKQSIIEGIAGGRMARSSVEDMERLTRMFLCRDVGHVGFEDVELFDVLFGEGEKRRLLAAIKADVDLENELLGMLRGRRMYFMRQILGNRRAFEHFLEWQLRPGDRERARRQLKGVEGGMPFVKYIDSDALSLMRGTRVIDLEKTSGGGSTEVTRTGYPAGATVRYENGAEIVFVPGRRVAVEFDDRPADSVKRLFGDGFRLNYVQSVVQDAVLGGDGSVVVCAPTGSGKTVIGMMAILREVEKGGRRRVGYVAPMKALVRELCSTIGRVFSGRGIRVVEHTSDVYSGYGDLEQAGVIVSTPEKFDLLTRNTGLLFDLVVIDEIHIVGDSRGAAVEAIVARMSMGRRCRFVGLSATLPNHMDVGEFLGCSRADVFHFGAEFRRSAIDYEMINVGARERELVVTVEKVLESLERGGPVLVFVHSRRETLEVAREIKRYMERIGDAVQGGASAEVAELLRYRVGVHHAGLDKATRGTVEDLYRAGAVDVMVCTATLAWGVNLPGKTVIVKGTEVYDGSVCGWRDVGQIDMMQMFGRAGRSGDDGSRGILVCSKQSEFLVQRSIESRLLPSLCDCLNAEIVRGLRRFEDAMDWFKHTFYYTRLVRMSRDPARMAKEIVYSALRHLEDGGLIRLLPAIHATDMGVVASRYYVHYRDVRRLFDGLSGTMLEASLFAVLEGTRELSGLRVDPKEMEALKGLVPVPTESAVGMAVQCHIANRMESGALAQNLCRLLRALFEAAVRRRLGVSKMVLGWCKGAAHGVFPYQTPLRHFVDDEAAMRDLEMKEIPFGMLEELGKEGLDQMGLCGGTIAEHLRYVPRFNVSVGIRVVGAGTYVMSVGLEKAFDDSKVEGKTYHLFVTDSSDRELVVWDTVVFADGCEYVCQNYGVSTGSPFLNVCLLSNDYLCPVDPVVADLRGVGSVPCVFGSGWRDAVMSRLEGTETNCIKLGLFWDEIDTEVAVVPTQGEKRRLMQLGYRAYTYEEFASQKIDCGSATILEVHDVISNHLIEACIVHCVVRRIRMVLMGLPFTEGGGIESLGRVEGAVCGPRVDVWESCSLTHHGQLSDFWTRLSMEVGLVDTEEASCLVICPTARTAAHFMGLLGNARACSEHSEVLSGVHVATKRVVDSWIRRRWTPQADQVHVVGADYYDHESKSYVDYPIADVKRYSLLGKRALLYLKQSKVGLYFRDGTVPLYYCSSERREIGVYSHWMGCPSGGGQDVPLAIKDGVLTRYGTAMCRYGVGAETVELFVGHVKDKMGLKSIQALVCGAGELVWEMDDEELKALSRAGVDVSRGRAYGMTSYVVSGDARDEWALQHYGEWVLPVVRRLYLCLVEVSMEKACLKTAFNAMFGLQNVVKAFAAGEEAQYSAELSKGSVVIEVRAAPASALGQMVFFLCAGTQEFQMVDADGPGTYATPWRHRTCYVMSEWRTGFLEVVARDG